MLLLYLLSTWMISTYSMQLKCDGKYNHPNDCSYDHTIDIKCAVCKPSEQILSLTAVEQCRAANDLFPSQAISKTTRDDINPKECGKVGGFWCVYTIDCNRGMVRRFNHMFINIYNLRACYLLLNSFGSRAPLR